MDNQTYHTAKEIDRTINDLTKNLAFMVEHGLYGRDDALEIVDRIADAFGVWAALKMGLEGAADFFEELNKEDSPCTPSPN